MTETVAVTDSSPTQDNRREFSGNGLPSLEAPPMINSESEILLSPGKRRCVNPKNQYNGDVMLNEGNQPGSNIGFNVNNFVSEIKVTVSDYISQQYLVRGSPNYKVLKDKIREFCLSMKPTGMKDDASCSVLYLVYKSLPELKRTDEADSIIRKMIGKHIRNAKYRAKCKLRECKMTEPDKAAAGAMNLSRTESQDKVNYSPEALLHPSLLLMLQSEAYKMSDPIRSEMLQASMRDSQLNIPPGTVKRPASAEDIKIVSLHGGSYSSVGLNNSTNDVNKSSMQPPFSTMSPPDAEVPTCSTSSYGLPSGIINSNGILSEHSASELPPYPDSEYIPNTTTEIKVERDASLSLELGNSSNNELSTEIKSPTSARPGVVKPRLLINATRRAEQSPPKQATPRCPRTTELNQVNEMCEHRLKFITGLTYACFLCNDYFERVPAERLICQHCKKVFSHRHLLLQHNNEVHAFANATR